jgi:hypothetical protein
LKTFSWILPEWVSSQQKGWNEVSFSNAGATDAALAIWRGSLPFAHPAEIEQGELLDERGTPHRSLKIHAVIGGSR